MPKPRDPHATTRWSHTRAAPLSLDAWGPDSAPLLWSLDWAGLVDLGLARWEYQIRVRAGESTRVVVRRAAESEDGAHLLDEMLARHGAFASAGAALVVDEDGLRDYRPHEPPERLRPAGGEWLWRRRAEVEPSGVLTASAWCTHCGSYFEDGRVAVGSVERIARWCSTCPQRTRRLPPYRKCAAPDCSVVFAPSRANATFCGNRCRSATGGRAP